MNWDRVICVRIAVPPDVDMEIVGDRIMDAVAGEYTTNDGKPAQLNGGWMPMGDERFADWLWEDVK